MTTRIGGGPDGSNARMEADLSSWLRDLEPSQVPVRVRARASADLRAEAARPSRRVAGFWPVLSSTATLAVLVLGLAMLVMLALAGSSLSVVGAPGWATPVGPGGSEIPDSSMPGFPTGADPLRVLATLLVSGLIAAGLCRRSVQARISRLAIGRTPAGVPAVRPLPRSLGSVPRVVWALLALAAVGLACAIISIQSATLPINPFVELMVLAVLLIPPAIAVRYPRTDRSGRLLNAGGLATAAGLVIQLPIAAPGLYAAVSTHLSGLSAYLLFVVPPTLATVFLAAGLAGRAGQLRRPPAILVFGVATATLFVTIGMYAWLGDEPIYSTELLLTLALALAGVLTAAAWLVVLWVGLSSGLRRGGTLGWRLVAGAGALYVGETILNEAGWILQYQLLQTDWYLFMQRLAWCLLLVALLSGLRPAQPPAPHPAAEGPAGNGDTRQSQPPTSL
jgi:hypothetical protein